MDAKMLIGIAYLVAYSLAYLSIGVVTGVLFHKLWRGDDRESNVIAAIVGACGAILGGVLWLSMLMYSWFSGWAGGAINMYVGGPDGLIRPSFWLTLFTATMGALAALATYYFFRDFRADIHAKDGWR